ncbi:MULTISPECIES: DUF885 domain-containing protein [Brevibacterium]|uniref:DUF885 domain-containing protein n=1 Tax=Brevibacterium salitolerans TaxID=1403566 RepID=A0ABP5HWE7_9MICO|nr:DUF885 domain-containing protein [Brevibacterium sp.]
MTEQTATGTAAGTPATAPRTPTPVDEVAETHFRSMLDLSPALRVEVGAPGREDELDDFSPGGWAARDDLAARTLSALEAAESASRAAGTFDETDAVTAHALRERLGLEREIHAIGADASQLDVIASPVQAVRDFFDLVPTASAEDWEANASRLRAVSQALAGHRESLLEARAGGRIPARTQVEAVIAQAQAAAEAGGHFDRFVAGAADSPDADRISAGLRAELTDAAHSARTAYSRFASFLHEQMLPEARADDAVGREEYALHSRTFLGTTVDLDETYEWGLEQLASIDAEQQEIAAELYPGSSVTETMRRLDADPLRRIHGLDGLRRWMQETADEATAALAGTHFDIPDEVRTIECMVLEDGTGGIYYTPPTSDFSRPGRMWWSVPSGVESFATWQERTTVYHEGVPGHHLQLGATVMREDRLNAWRRQGIWVSGHGEGWALYAERLMDELGFLADPGDRFGMLDSQRLRAARVCVDIGVHCRKQAPSSVGGGVWDREKAWAFLTENVAMEHSFLDFELKRYLGWPGQAPSYSVGQRIWQQIREEVRTREEAAGRAFSLRDFHSRALGLGSVGLSTLQKALVEGF